MITARRQVATGLLALAATGSLIVPMPAPAQAITEVDLHARMLATAAFPNVRGDADYESDRDGRDFEIHIAGVRALAGHRLTVRVEGDFVGRMVVGPHGRAHLERHSGVPRMAAGDVVRVRTGKGKLVTRGTLRHESPG